MEERNNRLLNAIEAAKITKKLKNFTLDVENFAIPQSNTEFHKVFSFFKWTAILMTSV